MYLNYLFDMENKVKTICFNGTAGHRSVGLNGVQEIIECFPTSSIPHYHFLVKCPFGVRERIFGVSLVEYFPDEGPGQVKALSEQQIADLVHNQELQPMVVLDAGYDVDYRELLAKYISHVKAIEGISFIDRSVPSSHDYQLTGSELMELEKIENYSKEKYG